MTSSPVAGLTVFVQLVRLGEIVPGSFQLDCADGERRWWTEDMSFWIIWCKMTVTYRMKVLRVVEAIVDYIKD